MTAPLAPLVGLLRAEPALAELLSGGDSAVAVADPARAFVLAGLGALGHAPVLLVATPTGAEAERIAHDLGVFHDPASVAVLPAWETLPFERVSPAAETMGSRLRTLWRIDRAHRRDAAAGRRVAEATFVVVAPVRALLQRLAATGAEAAPVVIRRGGELDPAALVAELVAAGYRREYQVEHRGEVAVRGGIVDLFPSTGDDGVRVDCYGDLVERLTVFDVVDQRSVRDLDVVEVFGCRELRISEARRAVAARLADSAPFARERFARIAAGEVFDGLESFLPWLDPGERLVTDLLGDADRVVLVEPRRMRDRAVEILDEEAALAASLAETWRPADSAAALGAAGFPALHASFDRLLAGTSARVASLLATAESPRTGTIRVSGWPQVFGDAAPLARRIGELTRAGGVVAVAAEAAGSAARIADVLDEAGVAVDRLDLAPEDPAGRAQALRRPGTHVVVASLDRGFALEGAHVAVLAESDLTGRHRPHRVPRPRARPVEGFFDDLAVGSYVVHHVHGVARYGGMVRRGVAGIERDYLLLEYRGGDRLYVPSDQIDAITPYTGGEHPSLSRLNGRDWQRSRARVRQAVRAVAQELVVLYRRRLASPGHGFAPDTPWQAELEQSFPYPETADQLRAIAEVKADMERPVPMDRLVCGDVGFGKTEVALRAAFKAVQDGAQVAVLVPTTILARQHYQTIADRFAPYPVRVEMLSRFLTAGEAAAVVRGVADGAVDVVVGTHRLLGDDVRFRRLGLLVVDEEQRFGVNQKEAMKKLAIGVDVLTLTANPIPRTLEMGLTGIRDLSVIDTPPAERQPILTYVGEEDDRAVAEAIRRELLREGQVFFVHHRVEGIERVAARVSALAPEARVAIAHGQMDEGSLEKTVVDFAEGRYDVLVCTTIIESGIDMPAVNTLVVDRADLLGLGQLHQLRGRVGRSSSRAYAYLFHPRDRVLTEQAYERLRTIGEHTELGSGFKIAMRDLEIRGAGSLLGTDQSGHIAAVGYDLYVRMVAEAVAELKGEEVAPPSEVRLDVPLDAHLPASYVAREDLRLEAYRRLAAVRGVAEVDDIGAEWLDRYGPLPPPASSLLEIARLRAECVRVGVTEVTVVAVRPGSLGPGRAGEALARLTPLRLPASARVRLSRLAPRAILKEDPPQLVVPLAAGPQLPADLVALLAALVPTESPAPARA
ncbi:MAG: transcription-repair coupling factor [Acidimicrobiales bacterium]